MNWPSLFESAFTLVAPKLETVLDFAGCRESWLQAEICLHLRERGCDIKTNAFSLGRGCKVDFSATRPTPMLAELKLLGNGYAYRCFDGIGQLDRFQPPSAGQRVAITAHDLAHAGENNNNFLRDCARLSRLDTAVERYIILVIDRRGKMDALGRALLAAKLSDAEWTWEPPSGSYLVRQWRLDGEELRNAQATPVAERHHP